MRAFFRSRTETDLRAADLLGRRVTEVCPGIGKREIVEIYGKVALIGEPPSFEQRCEGDGRYYQINACEVEKVRFAVTFEVRTEWREATLQSRGSSPLVS
ncbi:MAG: hypothetical protein WCG31_09940 [Deltaproteobacteria bacterium]|jgi:hypothetical protein